MRVLTGFTSFTRKNSRKERLNTSNKKYFSECSYYRKTFQLEGNDPSGRKDTNKYRQTPRQTNKNKSKSLKGS